MATKTIHVVPSRNEWLVEESGELLSTHRTQAEAEKFARGEAMRARGKVVVHGREGRIERKDSFGDEEVRG